MQVSVPVFPLDTVVDIGEDLALLAACNHSINSYGRTDGQDGQDGQDRQDGQD